MAVKLKMSCSNCGSDDVVRDAWAEWDFEKQQWVMRGDPMDDAYCQNCDYSGNNVIKVDEIEDKPEPIQHHPV